MSADRAEALDDLESPPLRAVSNRHILRMRGIHVEYNGVPALKGVDFDLYEGEIHALVGEHRAGKSSLVKLMSGAVQKSQGEIIYRGVEVKSFSPESAIQAGIGMVYQNLNVIPNLNAMENIFAGRMIQRRLRGLNRRRMFSICAALFRRLNIEMDLELPLYRLSQAQQLMVEFARMLFLNPRLMILDELSNKLTPEEMATIYDIVSEFRSQGKSIIYITHDMEETLKIADRVTILKDGYRRGTERVADLDRFRLFELTYSFALGKREIEANRMQFYLLKRYSESFIRHLPIGIMILDADDVVQLANFAGIENMQLGPVQVNTHSFDALLAGTGFPIARDIREKVAAREEYVWEEVRVGDDKQVRVDVFPLRDDESSFIGTVLLVHDVSIDRYMKDYLIRAEKMATVAEVAAGVAHEINNPLFIIRNYVELLKNKKLDPDDAERIAKIEKELGRIVEIIGSLLSFSKVKELPESRTNLVEVIEEAILLLQHNLSKKNIRLDKELCAGRVEIVGEENRLKQLFLNLLLNSIDAVLDGGIVRVKLLAHIEDRFAEVTVEDNGYGIPADIQGKIFNPFFSTKMNKKNTGLGLSICQHIAEAHNGIITFTSTPGHFTEFKVKLPLN
ncbi:MAG: ATP-binding cassette domain-containing protein [Spirochaetia bacterium]|jgi:two-component system sensor histidine kinase AtoS